MKNSFVRILSYLAILIFLLHWAVAFILAMPANYVKQTVANHASRYQTMFSSWNFFTPPFIYHNRLYFIVRDSKISGNRQDTIEVLANISLQKQIRVPFNQRENIIDHLVNNSVAGLKRVVRSYKITTDSLATNKSDSLTIARSISNAEGNNNYKRYLATLTNYCKIVLQQKNIDIIGKEVKIVIKEKEIRPFKQIGDASYLQKEILVFETTYKPVNP